MKEPHSWSNNSIEVHFPFSYIIWTFSLSPFRFIFPLSISFREWSRAIPDKPFFLIPKVSLNLFFILKNRFKLTFGVRGRQSTSELKGVHNFFLTCGKEFTFTNMVNFSSFLDDLPSFQLYGLWWHFEILSRKT